MEELIRFDHRLRMVPADEAALRYRGDLDAALAEYLGALDRARSSVPQLIDFALQHLGKHYLEAGRPTDAIACLEEALELRRAKGDQALVESTLAALRLSGRDV